MSTAKSYIFIDESGKPEIFSTKGTNLVENGSASRYLILAAIRTNDQLQLQQKVVDFKLQLLKDSTLTDIFSSAYSLDAFHAQIDYPQVRERFYSFIASLEEIKIDVIIVEKLKCYPALQRNPGKLYGVMSGQLLKNICHQSSNTEIIFSRKDSKLKLRQELEIEVERVRLDYIQKHPKLQSNLNLQYFHNPHYTHGGLQIADYIAFALYQVYERNQWRWFELVAKKIGKIQDICNKKYFTQSNPLQLSP
ncbi:DUF3800 domain-containing protein [Candidatus Roizmanbacteria bacterium]|nr:DUF3800 domain-containing protein [Candidatus Roizmanbacteria bacterium]